LIGKGLFLDGLTRILDEQPDTEIVAAVRDWELAREIFYQASPNIVIVDHDEPELQGSDLNPLLESATPSMTVIYLTLSNNKMIIHNRQELTDVSVPDLITALHPTAREVKGRK
jgi:DNA-binding NarL/FixJ family response regulator